jgi:hypothetical protein
MRPEQRQQGADDLRMMRGVIDNQYFLLHTHAAGTRPIRPIY